MAKHRSGASMKSPQAAYIDGGFPSGLARYNSDGSEQHMVEKFSPHGAERTPAGWDAIGTHVVRQTSTGRRPRSRQSRQPIRTPAGAQCVRVASITSFDVGAADSSTAFVAGCILAIPVASWRGERRVAGWLAAVVAGEVAVLVFNRWRCPLRSGRPDTRTIGGTTSTFIFQSGLPSTTR